jgi:hypothetical protein
VGAGSFAFRRQIRGGCFNFFIFSCLDAADPVRNPALKLFVGGVVAYGVAFIYIGAYLS